MNTSIQSPRCSDCNQALALDHVGPCPKCGGTRKTYGVSSSMVTKLVASLSWVHVHEYYEKHPVWLAVVIGITFGSPFVGLFLAGLPGVGVGIIIGLISLLLGIYAVTKVRVEREGHSR